MTQDVQPLTWQKRTNIEEHQQFFSKINEIIANLAPTVEEAEAAIAQATAAIASANAASAAASAAASQASAAASQAQTAASTVAGYDSRLTAAEGDIDALDGNAVKKTGESSQSIAGDISVSGALSAGGNTTVGGNLGVTGQSVLSGNVSMPGGCSLGGNPTAPDVPAGVYGTFIANANKVKAELDAYAPMVRTTGNQSIAGNKSLTGTLELSAYEAIKVVKPSGSPAMSGNTRASQQVLDQYINTADGGEWMVRNTIYQGANSKNYSRILYLRRYDDNDQILQATFTFSIDASGKGHLTVEDSNGTIHQVI